MASLHNQHVEKHFPRKETVLLNFDKKDSQIARNWSKAAENEALEHGMQEKAQQFVEQGSEIYNKV